MASGLVANEVIENSDCIVTGYFASVSQVKRAARLISQYRVPGVPVIVDAIIGDFEKGLYVDAAIADAIVQELFPLAHIVRCNAWEFWQLGRLLGHFYTIPEHPQDVETFKQWVSPLENLPETMIVSSVDHLGKLGLLGISNGHGSWCGRSRSYASHIPNGLGDYLTALIAHERMSSRKPVDQLIRTVMERFSPVFEAQYFDRPGELRLPELKQKKRREISSVEVW